MFIVVEVQTNANGAVAIVPPSSYETQLEAEAKYHTVLAAAAASSLPKHGAIIFTEELFPVMHHFYKHEPVQEPETSVEE